MPLTALQLTDNPIGFYVTAPVTTNTPNNQPFVIADGTGKATLTFPQVASGQVYTGSITVNAVGGGGIPGTVWTITRDGTTPFLTWYDNQIALDIQARDGQTISIMGTGLVPGTKVNAVWTGRNDPNQGAVPIVAPSVSGSSNPINLRGTTQQGSSIANPTVAAAGTVTLLNGIAINQPSFEAVFTLNLPAGAGTVPFAILGVAWQDAVTGLQVGFKQYALTAGNGPTNPISVYLSGPCRGNQLVLTLQNLDPAQVLTYNWLFNTLSYTYTVDRLLQPSYSPVNPITFANPAGNPSKGLLFASAPTVGPNGTIIRLCAASNAKCKINIDDSAQANPWALTIADPATLYNAAANNELYKFNGIAGSVFETEIQMPNGPTLFTLANSAATNSIVLGVTVLIMEY